MTNEHAPSMLHDGSVMVAPRACREEGLGGPPVVPLRFSRIDPFHAVRTGPPGHPCYTCASAGGQLSRLPKLGRLTGSGWVGIRQGGEAYLGRGRHRTPCWAISWQICVLPTNVPHCTLKPSRSTFVSFILALGVARGLSWLGPGAMGTAPRPAAGPQAASEWGAVFGYTNVYFCIPKVYK